MYVAAASCIRQSPPRSASTEPQRETFASSRLSSARDTFGSLGRSPGVHQPVPFSPRTDRLFLSLQAWEIKFGAAADACRPARGHGLEAGVEAHAFRTVDGMIAE